MPSSNKTADPCAHEAEVRDIARVAAAGLRDGTLTLKDVLGLTPAEIASVGRLANTRARRGDLGGALTLHATLASCDPYEPSHWRSMEALHTQLGSHAGALLCHEVLALLCGRDAEGIRREAVCVSRLGLPRHARRLRAYSKMFHNPDERGRTSNLRA